VPEAGLGSTPDSGLAQAVNDSTDGSQREEEPDPAAVVRRVLEVLGARLRDRAGDRLDDRLDDWGDREFDQPAVVRWDVTAQSANRSATLSFQMVADDGGWVVAPGVAAAPAAMIGLAVTDLLELADGHLDGMQAFLTGRIRLSGDLLLARALLSAWPRQPGGRPPDG
jgi:hypothetical protein